MLRLQLLGGVDLRDQDGREVRALVSQPKRLALLVYLALAKPAAFVRRDTLLALLWPESDAEHARNALRQAVHFLRRLLGRDAITSHGNDELALDPSLVWTDARALADALDRGDLQGAVELYRGELLPGFSMQGAAAFVSWLEEARQGLQEQSAQAAWQLSAQAEAGGHGSIAVHWARWAVRVTPDDEAALRRLLELCSRAGDRAAAVRAYEEFADRLARDLGGTPAPETSAAVGPRRESPVAPPAPPDRASRRAPAPALPPGPPAPTWPAPRVPRRVIVAIGAGLVVLGVAAIAGWSRRPHAHPGDDVVAVFPFSVRGRPDLAYLSDGLIELLSTKLDGAAGLRVIDPRAVTAAVPDARGPAIEPLDQTSGGAAAERLGARLYVLGGVVEIAGRLQISASMYDRTRGDEPVARATAETDASQVLTVIDRLAADLLAERAGADTALARMAAATTTSLPAFRAYLDGERAYRAGRFAQAVEDFQRATAADTNYALAYYRLAAAADWVGNGTLVHNAVRAALRHHANLSPLVLQLLQGFGAYYEGASETAEQIYHGLVTTHPDHVEAAYMLGETRFHYNAARGRRFTESRAQFERVLTLEPHNPHALLHLARIAAAEGRRAEVAALAREFLVRSPDADRALEMRALRAFMLGDSVEQAFVRAALDDASDVALDEAVRAIAVFAGNPAAAVRLAPAYDRPGRTPNTVATGRDLRIQFQGARGRWRDARRETDALAPFDRNLAVLERALLAAAPFSPFSQTDAAALREDIAHWAPARGPIVNAFTTLRPQFQAYLTGLLDARLGDGGAVRRAAAGITVPASGPWPEAVLDLRHSLLAEAARLDGQPLRAVSEIEHFHFDPQSMLLVNFVVLGGRERFLRASLLQALGRDEEALEWYESFPNPNGRDLLYLAPALLRRAEIETRLGRRDAAAAHYARFIELWKDCDPELRPVVAQARQALAALAPLH